MAGNIVSELTREEAMKPKSRAHTPPAVRACLAAIASIGLLTFVASDASAQTRTLRCWHGESTEVTLPGGQKLQTSYQGGATKLKEVIERETGGKYKVEIFPLGQLYGGEREALEALKIGALDCMITASAPLGAWEPTIAVLDLPFLFSDLQAARRLLDGPTGREILDKLEKHGLKGLAIADNSFRQLETRGKKVEKAEDLQGMKIRVMESRTYIEMFKALGASPIPLPFSEVYTGVQTGVLDGYEHPISAYIGSRMYEVAKNVTLTNHTLTAVPYLLSLRTWQQLPPDVQQVMLRAAVEARDAHRKVVDDFNKLAVDILTKEGVSFSTVDAAAFQKKMEPVYSLFENQIGKDLLNRVKEAK
jgi:tripartite ATP-independent transporter DctP family solute receptor